MELAPYPGGLGVVGSNPAAPTIKALENKENFRPAPKWRRSHFVREMTPKCTFGRKDPQRSHKVLFSFRSGTKKPRPKPGEGPSAKRAGEENGSYCLERAASNSDFNLPPLVDPKK